MLQFHETIFMVSLKAPLLCKELPNGLRYPLVGGTRGRHFAGTHSKPHKLPENAATPTSRVHAVLGGFCSSRLNFFVETSVGIVERWTR